MGYAGFSLKEISRVLLPARQSGPQSWHAEGDRSWGKLNLISDYPQEIAIRAVPSWPSLPFSLLEKVAGA
jgi:hypothetical protein